MNPQEKFINDRSVLVAAADKVGLSGAAEYLADPTNGQREVSLFCFNLMCLGYSKRAYYGEVYG